MLYALLNKLGLSRDRYGIKNFENLPPRIQNEVIAAMEAQNLTDIR